MPIDRFKLIAEVYLLFRRGDEVLLSLRANTGFRDGEYGLVSGHVDGGEPLAAAAAREALEEAGVALDPRELTLQTVMHRCPGDERIGFFFEPARWQGEIVNAEPHKCDGLAWFALDALPANTIPYVREALANAVAGVAYDDRWAPDD
ncbi:MAG TPA: NUDIX domain-containing protein [Caulobacteraceae bacterium]|jgi:8-oxo-dGTP pyrophosphatase MutT (NUDIX family)